MKINYSDRILPLLPILYALSLMDVLKIYSLIFKFFIVLIVLIPFFLFNKKGSFDRQWILATFILISISIFSFQLGAAFLTAFILGRLYNTRINSLYKSANLLLIFLIVFYVFVKFGLISNSLISNSLIQVDNELGRNRYNFGFKYVTTFSVLLVFLSCVYYIFNDIKLLLFSVMFSFLIMIETGTRTGFFYSMILLLALFTPFIFNKRFNYFILICLLLLLSQLVYNYLGFDYLNLILSDRLAQNFILFSSYVYDPSLPIRSDFIFLNILARASYLGYVIIFLWIYMIAFYRFTITGKSFLLLSISFLVDSGGSLFSIILMFSFINNIEPSITTEK